MEGRTVIEVFLSTSADPADRAGAGRFVIVALSPEDEDALLAERVRVRPQGGGNEGGRLAGGSDHRANRSRALRASFSCSACHLVGGMFNCPLLADTIALAPLSRGPGGKEACCARDAFVNAAIEADILVERD